MILGIYGCGGLGREALEIARQCNHHSHRWDEILFIDDTPGETPVNGCRVTSFEDFQASIPPRRSEICVAVGEPAVRKRLFERIRQSGYPFTSLVHPSVHIPESTRIGSGVIIDVYSFISCNTTIGDNVYFQPHSGISHDCVLANHIILSPGAVVAGNCHIGEGAYIGLNAAVREQTRIGAWSVIGMSAMVCGDVPEEVVVAGNPAKMMRGNTERRVFRGKS